MKTLAGIKKLVQDCAFQDVVPNSWIAPVNGIVPGSGFFIDWDGVWFEPASGVSVENFIRKNTGEDIIRMMHKINSSEVFHQEASQMDPLLLLMKFLAYITSI